jgi:integrase
LDMEGRTLARRVANKDLENRSARRKLKARGKPYFTRLDEGLHLGYRRLTGDRSGTWVIRFYAGKQSYAVETVATADDLSDPNGIDVLDYDQATKKARELRDERARRGVGGPVTVADAMRAYIGYLTTHRKTGQDVSYSFAAHIEGPLGHIEVAKLTTPEIRAWHANLAKQPARTRTRRGDAQRHREGGMDDEVVRRRRSSANRVLTTLKSALTQAFDDGLVDSDLAWRRVKAFERVDAARQRFLSTDECVRLINASDPDDFGLLVRAALESGMRYGELGRLNVGDFDRDTATLAVRVSKSGKPRRVVLTNEACSFFAQLCTGRPGEEPLLRKRSGARWLNSDQKRRMRLACQRARISPVIGFHGLRHTYASLAVMAEMPLSVLAQNLGHATIKMLEAHYAHLSPSYVADAVRRSAPRFNVEGSNVRPLR